MFEVTHRLLSTWHARVRQARPWKVLHPGCVRCHRIDCLYLRPNFRRVPPIMKLDPNPGMISHPFTAEALGWCITAVPIDDQDALETLFRHGVKNVADHPQKCFGSQRDRPRKSTEIGRYSVSEYGKDRHAHRLGRFNCNSL